MFNRRLGNIRKSGGDLVNKDWRKKSVGGCDPQRNYEQVSKI